MVVAGAFSENVGISDLCIEEMAVVITDFELAIRWNGQARELEGKAVCGDGHGSHAGQSGIGDFRFQEAPSGSSRRERDAAGAFPFLLDFNRIIILPISEAES